MVVTDELGHVLAKPSALGTDAARLEWICETLMLGGLELQAGDEDQYLINTGRLKVDDLMEYAARTYGLDVQTLRSEQRMIEQAERDAMVAAMFAAGMPLGQVAKELGMSRAAVEKRIKQDPPI